ncbi:olfactory receptor 1B1-like [Vombatus ursinus]|uniref:G-protein coupled receptors family 1 profile domain-containing protein n=1 Tax=Vombatus ursinus TaxID=29139 RepID=A0A4X2KQB7_VOMUR|nr:olfactory receptor 1B1-like [Vombatus ursinus]XP_027723834.1 olfactory receptor 1B1-like [Vombatus ursinus]
MSCSSNASHTPTFLLVGLWRGGPPNHLLFPLFLVAYVAAVMGNLMLVLLISWDSQLGAPMYYLLRGLSVVDAGQATVTLPQLLAHLVSPQSVIPAARCLAQFFFFYLFAVTDTLVVVVMALDHYVAICDPLHYSALMNHHVCDCLMASCLILSLFHSILHSGLLLPLQWAGDSGGTVYIPHFFCDHWPLVRASCSNTQYNVLAIFLEGSLFVTGPCALILFSYARIAAAIFRLHSAAGHWRAVSTCSSHLTMVCFLYGTVIWVYFQSPSHNSPEQDMAAAVMYTAITPLANPFVYSFRNKNVKNALHRLLSSSRVNPQLDWP